MIAYGHGSNRTGHLTDLHGDGLETGSSVDNVCHGDALFCQQQTVFVLRKQRT